MNLWECDHSGCTLTCVGVGGAVGLRAIGWWFEPGPRLLCPQHRPDFVPCHQENRLPQDGPGPAECRLCVAESEARLWQNFIKAIKIQIP